MTGGCVSRTAREISTLDPLEAGDHVGWIVRDREEFAWLTSRHLRQGSAAGDKLFLFGPDGGLEQASAVDDAVTVLNPGKAFLGGGAVDPEAMLGHFREQHILAREQGFRGLRVVADMDWLLTVQPTPTAAGLVDFEQRLDRFVADTDAIIVCAYRPENFAAAELAEVMCVHPHTRGAAPEPVGFRMWSGGGDVWQLSGDIDVNSGNALRERLRSAAASKRNVTLDLTGIRFIDLAGLRTIAAFSVEQAVSVTVEGMGDTMRKCWNLLDLDAFAPYVEWAA
jgi:anti-anti-sigma factor